ncbi:MAG: aldose 1-epimerase [Escherichia coli]|nr:aldose 1-epimerase [Escherichia coli]
MTIYTLSHGSLKLDVSDQGGVIEGFWRDTTPLLRPGKKSGVATDASCFPLVPFANRVSGNRFVWQGREYQLQPNVEWDAHYLHGDGWLGEWQCVSHSDDSLWIQAQASGYWLEREQWLAGEFCEQLPQELDFNQPAPLPRQWVNNGFAGWNGQARIEQPQEGYAIIMETTPPAPCYFIFVSDPAFDKGYAFDFFCLEPMSHAPDDHHRPEGGDLIALAPGESTTSEMSLRVEWL